MIDGGIVAGYLATLVVRGAGRFVDGRIDELLKALYGRVMSRLGREAEEVLSSAPTDVTVQRRIAGAIENIAYSDQGFARDLEGLMRRLDQAGARRLMNQVFAETGAQHFGSGDVEIATHGGRITKNYFRAAASPSNYSNAPMWVKVAAWAGGLLVIGGPILIVVNVATVMSSGTDKFGRPAHPGLSDLRPGAIVFGVGLVILILASIRRSTSRRGW